MTAEKVIFTNAKGQSVELTNRLPFLLESVEGRGEVDADVQMQTAPYQDGATYVDSLLATRSITLNVSLIAENRDDLNSLRHQISSVFNPKMGKGKLVYSNSQTEREIEVVVDGSPAFPVGDAKGKWFQRTAINLIAPDPYWRDIFTENYKLEDFVDVTTGEFIKVNRTIPPGYKLVLDTSFGNKRVEIVAPDGVVENAFHYIDLESTFFSLEVGEIKFGFITEGGNPEVYVEYKHRYLSV